jgi:DNA-binding winged helix-turn-helix (wHTH) protein
MKQFDPFRLDAANSRLWRDEAQIVLPPKPFAVLKYLVDNPGRLITHNELLEALWPETYVQPQVLRTYVLELRKALGDDADNPRFIQTLPKRGYCFVAPVTDAIGVEGAGQGATAVHGREGMDFVNRTEELARFESEWARVAGGERRVVFLVGEAGIGKTALVDAFCQQAMTASPASVARGQCVPGVCSREDYYPILEALGQLCTSPRGEEACRILASTAPAWLAKTRQAASADGAATERTIAGLCAALESLAAEKPFILVLEDLHWADGATLDMVSALVRRRARSKLMVVATYRPRGEATETPLKAMKHDLLMRRLGEEITLAPLSRLSMADLLSGQLGQKTLPRGLSEFVHRRSEGNPLFAIAIVEHLIAQRTLVRKGENGTAEWELRTPLEQAQGGIPEGLVQMVEIGIERLSSEQQRVLEAGSLMPVAFPAWAVAAALACDEAEAEEMCDGLARRLHFVVRAGEDELPGGARSAFYAFAHEVYREVLYRRQAAPRRAQRQVRIAERLGELFKGREADVAREMAMHLEAAGSWNRAIEALRAAAQHAEHRRAHAEAAELRERAQRIEKREALTPEEGTRDEAQGPEDERGCTGDELAASGTPRAHASRFAGKNLTLSRREFDDFSS